MTKPGSGAEPFNVARFDLYCYRGRHIGPVIGSPLPETLADAGLVINCRKSSQTSRVPLCYFLNRRLANPANPTNPVPNKSIVAGSGTGTTPFGF